MSDKAEIAARALCQACAIDPDERVFTGSGYVPRWMTMDSYSNRVLAAVEPAIRAAAMEEAAKVAYGMPDYVQSQMKTDEAGNLLPGSVYDQGRYDAATAIRKLAKSEGGDDR